MNVGHTEYCEHLSNKWNIQQKNSGTRADTCTQRESQKRHRAELCDLIKLQELCVRVMNNADIISEKRGEKEANAN